MLRLVPVANWNKWDQFQASALHWKAEQIINMGRGQRVQAGDWKVVKSVDWKSQWILYIIYCLLFHTVLPPLSFSPVTFACKLITAWHISPSWLHTPFRLAHCLIPAKLNGMSCGYPLQLCKVVEYWLYMLLKTITVLSITGHTSRNSDTKSELIQFFLPLTLMLSIDQDIFGVWNLLPGLFQLSAVQIPLKSTHVCLKSQNLAY